ncbi:glycosyl hydrolase, partial [Congregibacter sp.]|nr:glycosyl hydrolase [Congregibacter sp.]
MTTVGIARAADDVVEPGFNENTFAGLSLRSVGPALMAGRIADIVVHPDNPHVWYVAAGSGNVWKTVNSGTTWTTIFDDEDAYSIGCITLDPQNPDTVWLGTGENGAGRHFGYGAGVYRSRDGGASWENMGLGNSEHIGMIAVDPRDSDVVFVAAQGPMWSAGGERGLYRSRDGGVSWERVLGNGLGNTPADDAYTGVSEVHFDPRDPQVLFAASWQRFRNVAVLMDGGPGSGIHKSEDGGTTWRELNAGLPDGNMGKIGLAISPQQPDVIYATIELANKEGGFWRSDNGGERWEKRSDYLSGGTGPHYYQEIFASPNAFDRIYQMDVFLHRSDDGGANFKRMEADTKHVDHHAMAFRKGDPNYLLVGNDGGLYESFDGGEHWKYAANLPITQFYKVSVDYAKPFYNIYAGAQDNSSLGGPSRTDNVVGIRNEDWFLTTGADGHQSVADPTNPNIVYASWQQGSLSRYDAATGEMVVIQPQAGPGEPAERYNWDAPILISPHDSRRLYHASHRVWRSDDRGDSWTPISGDLSGGPGATDRLEAPLMGRTWSVDSSWDLSAMSQFHTITSLSESPQVEGLLYAGT